jgi:phosphoglycerate dehydrogenase-like enzyme
LKILVSIQQPVSQWQIPSQSVAALRFRFPHHEFVHATTPDERARALRDCEIAYTWILSADEASTAGKLAWVHTSAVAVETICLKELFARRIAVTNTRGVQAVPIAEHVCAVTLALARNLPLALARQRESRWSQNEFAGTNMPWLLRDRTLGLIGVGTIGSEIAKRARAFGMRVVALRRRAELGTVPGVDDVFTPARLPAMLGQTHVLVIAAPLTAETQAMIGADQFAQLPRGAVVINVGRARIIDNDALVTAIQSGHLGGAALDVFPQEPLPTDHPLWKTPNVILTPHTSGFRQGHWDEVVELFGNNLERFERGEPLQFRIVPELGY